MELWLPILILLFGGLIKGLNGFGYALVSTSLLSVFIPAQTAVAIMIIPLIVANLELASNLGRSQFQSCMDTHLGFLASLVAGVTTGMVFISWIPAKSLKMLVGLISILFVFSRIWSFKEKLKIFRRFEVEYIDLVIGLGSGIIYGASNVALPVVTYLKSQELSLSKFTSLLAAIVLVISVYRIILSSALGFYTGNQLVLSVIASVPGLLGVKIGEKLSDKVSGGTLEYISLISIVAIGMKLLISV